MKLAKYQGRLPECVEGFPEDCERVDPQYKGSLHLRPGQTVDLTDDEYAHIKTQRPDIAKNLVVLRSYQAEKKSAQ